jgi:hypothetical protein
LGVYDDLVTWSEGRPGWQRDALRRLATSGPLVESDFDELAQIALAQAGDGQATMVAEPIAAMHVPTAGNAPGRVNLVAVADAQNANSLAPGGRLGFEPVGITIVYGDNGSGKSGYVRILKRVCRARATPERVLPNLVAVDPRPTAATIDYTVDNEARSRPWTLTDTAVDELGAVTIFDRASAAVYMRSETEVAYRPLGLDLLDSLAQAARTVRRRLEALRAGNEPQCRTPPTALLAATALLDIWPIRAGITDDVVDGAASWDDTAAGRLIQIERVLAAPSPGDMAAGLQARRGLLVRAGQRSRQVERVIALADEVPEAAAAHDDAEHALNLARAEALGAADLPGVGGALWRAVWHAAEEYSTREAYVGHAFPHIGDGARCPLCAQELSAAARTRFELLRMMLEAELAGRVDETRARMDQLHLDLESIAGVLDRDALLDELRATDAEAADSLAALLTAAAEQAASAIRWIDARGDYERTHVPSSTSEFIRERLIPLDLEIDLLRRTTRPDELAELRVELTNLQARKWVAENREAIHADVARLSRSTIIVAAIESCETHPITAESGRLTNRYVTEALRADFARELADLNTSRIRVRIVPRGEYGATYHRLELEGEVDDARVSDVVSDGEFRAIALASFLAELGQGDSQSAIVLDDPVASLDHLYRERVAGRLVAEARLRQVIVFTHDLVFLHDLTSAAEREGVQIAYRRLRLTPTHVGWPLDEPPWLGMKVRQRIEALQHELNTLRAVYDGGDVEGYERDAKSWYGSLRETWERSVEEVLFGDAIGRYRHEVKTNNLTSERVWVLEEADVVQLVAGMTKSSTWIRGHDQPAAVNRPVPPPDELRDDLGALRDWAAEMRAKRRA